MGHWHREVIGVPVVASAVSGRQQGWVLTSAPVSAPVSLSLRSSQFVMWRPLNVDGAKGGCCWDPVGCKGVEIRTEP